MSRSVVDDVLDCLAPCEAIARMMEDHDDEEVRRTADRALRALAETRVLLHRGDMRAVAAALEAGLKVGCLSLQPHARMATVVADANARHEVWQKLWPDAERGLRVRNGNPAGRTPKADPAVLHAAVRKRLDAGDELKPARKVVAKRYGVSYTTVQRATLNITK